MKPILVTGGTGALGREVVAQLLATGHEVRVASRRTRPSGTRPYEWVTVDYRSGDGLDAAVGAVDAVIHCASDVRGEVDRALVAAARRARVPHLVYISIVGVDRIPLGYYRSKLVGERRVANSGLPWTVLRATQFHDLIRLLLAASTALPVAPVPGLRFQPVDVRDVAVRLAELVTGSPAGRAPDLGGPQVRDMGDLSRAYQACVNRRRPVVPFRLPGRAFRACLRGDHLTPGHADGRTTFEQYLAGHPKPASLSYRQARR